MTDIEGRQPGGPVNGDAGNVTADEVTIRQGGARAIAARPALLLADEPTGNLDSAHGHEVMRLLRELNAEGATLITVTHSAEHAALASRCIRLLDGRVLVDAYADLVS